MGFWEPCLLNVCFWAMNEQKKLFELKKQKMELALAMDRLACEKSLYYFYKEAFKVLEPSVVYKDNWHVEYLCFILQREFERIIQGKEAPYGEILVNVCPRSSKSLIFSVVFPVWAWMRDPSFSLITTSYSLDLGEKFSFQSQQLINSLWFRQRWEEEKTFSIDRRLGGKESVQYTVTNKNGTRKVASTGSNLTGFGGLIIIQDDPMNPTMAASDAETQAAITFYTATLSSRLNDQNTGVIMTIMQRLSETDVAGFILERGEENGTVLHINLPAIADGTEKMPAISKLPHLKPYPDGLMFPSLLGKKALERIKSRLGELEFATQYLQSPYPAEGLIAKKEHFTRISREEFDQKFRDIQKTWNFLADTSYGDSKKIESDPTGMMAYWYNPTDNKLYIRNAHSKKVPSENLHEYLKKYVDSNGKGPNSLIKIEPKASGKTVVGLIRKYYKELKVEEYKYKSGGVNINSSKLERLRAVLPYLSSGNVVLIDGLWTEDFINQIIGFPNAKHDEYVDLLCMAILDITLGTGGRTKRRLKLVN